MLVYGEYTSANNSDIIQLMSDSFNNRGDTSGKGEDYARHL